MRELLESFDNQKIIRQNKRHYLIIPMTDHYKATDPVILRQAVNAICDVVNWMDGSPITKIVSEEEKGGFIAVCVALQRGIAFSLAKQNPIRLPGEIGISKFKMAYSDEMSLYLNGLQKGDRVIIIDDVVDTGGTIIAMIKAVRKARVGIADVVCLAEKTEVGGVKRIKEETGIDVKTIIKLDTSGKKSKVLGTIFDLPRVE